MDFFKRLADRKQPIEKIEWWREHVEHYMRVENVEPKQTAKAEPQEPVRHPKPLPFDREAEYKIEIRVLRSGSKPVDFGCVQSVSIEDGVLKIEWWREHVEHYWGNKMQLYSDLYPNKWVESVSHIEYGCRVFASGEWSGYEQSQATQ